MKLVYTHENFVLVNNAKALLEQQGIEAELRNEFIGGGRGEIPVFETWPELWVVSPRHYDRAAQIIDEMLHGSEGDEWACGQCAEANGASFEFCWQCGTAQSGA